MCAIRRTDRGSARVGIVSGQGGITGSEREGGSCASDRASGSLVQHASRDKNI